MSSRSRLERIQASCGYTFNNAGLLQQALNPDKASLEPLKNLPTGQSLESLGRSVLQFILTEYLLNRYPEDADDLKERVRKQLLGESFATAGYGWIHRQIAHELNEEPVLVLAILGAIYTDAEDGYLAARECVHKLCNLPLLNTTDQSKEKKAIYWDRYDDFLDQTDGC